MTEPLVSSVVVHTEGAHEAVNVWLRGQLVGKLLVGKGDGERLRTQLLATYSLTQLLAERDALKATLAQARSSLDDFLSSLIDRIEIVTTDDGSFLDYVDHEQVETDLRVIHAALGPAPAQAQSGKTLGPWLPGESEADRWKGHCMASDELGSEYAERCKTLEATLEDVAKGSTHELVRWLLEKLIASEKAFEITQTAFAERCNDLKSQLVSKHKAMVKAVTEADKSSATLLQAREYARDEGDEILLQLLGGAEPTPRAAADPYAAIEAEERAEADRAAKRFDADDPRQQALDKWLGPVERKGE